MGRNTSEGLEYLVQETKQQLRKQEPERKRHLAQAGAKGSYSDSCEIMEHEEVSRCRVKRAAEWPGVRELVLQSVK